jgi:hypothetical protein
MEAMTPWNPQDVFRNSRPEGIVTRPDSVVHVSVHPAYCGQAVASQGQAVLLNALDQHRSSAQEWLEILQQEPAVDENDDFGDSGGELSDCAGLDGVWQDGSEDEG